MPKHLFLAHSAAPSGAELSLLRLAAQLPPDKTVVIFAEDGPLIQRYRDAGVEVITQKTVVKNVSRHERSLLRKFSALAAFAQYGWRLGEWAKRNQVTLIVANSVKSLIYGAVAAAYCRVPIIWSVHDRISPDYFRWLDALLIRTIGRILPSAYIVNSQATLETVWTGKKPALISPPGIIPSVAGELPPKNVSRLSQIAMIGRLSPWKGQLLFIEAFDRVFSNTDVRAVVVGDALFGEHEYAASVREFAAQTLSAERIRFTGNIKNVTEILRDSQILVHASIIPEPFGSVVIEGLDAGCAVIATTPGGPSEVITPGYDGLLVPCGNLSAMEEAMRLLAKDHGLRQKIASTGLIRAKDFDIRGIAQSLTSWLDAVEAGQVKNTLARSVPDRAL